MTSLKPAPSPLSSLIDSPQPITVVLGRGREGGVGKALTTQFVNDQIRSGIDPHGRPKRTRSSRPAKPNAHREQRRRRS